jgi:hypothetical protein
MDVSEPTPAVLCLVADDATERMPPVREDDDGVASALDEVTRAFRESADGVSGLETEDPPPAAPPRQARAVASLTPPPPLSHTPPPASSRSATPPTATAAARPATPSPLPSVTAPTPSPAAFTFAEASPSAPPLEASPRAALARMARLPARPVREEHAPPRYAPRKSDLRDLLAGFGVASVKTERELCSDLKALAGVEQTAPPPMVELSETPPPVAVDDVAKPAAAPPTPDAPSRARAVAGAVSAARVVAGVGLGSIPTRAASASAGEPAATLAADAPPEPAPCSAELTVRQVPSRSRVRLRVGPEAKLQSPSRVVGSDAVFEGLECGRGAEVTVELPGRARWMRIPVLAEALTPSPEEPGLVRYTVALR